MWEPSPGPSKALCGAQRRLGHCGGLRTEELGPPGLLRQRPGPFPSCSGETSFHGSFLPSSCLSCQKASLPPRPKGKGVRQTTPTLTAQGGSPPIAGGTCVHACLCMCVCPCVCARVCPHSGGGCLEASSSRRRLSSLNPTAAPSSPSTVGSGGFYRPLPALSHPGGRLPPWQD